MASDIKKRAKHARCGTLQDWMPDSPKRGAVPYDSASFGDIDKASPRARGAE
jgi:hypothetical protein